MNWRLERRGETDRGKMQSYMGRVAAVGSNVRDNAGRTTGVESERLDRKNYLGGMREKLKTNKQMKC